MASSLEQKLFLGAFNAVGFIPETTETVKIAQLTCTVQRISANWTLKEAFLLIAHLLEKTFSRLTTDTMTWMVHAGFAGRITGNAL
jgi:hypothetical protein